MEILSSVTFLITMLSIKIWNITNKNIWVSLGFFFHNYWSKNGICWKNEGIKKIIREIRKKCSLTKWPLIFHKDHCTIFPSEPLLSILSPNNWSFLSVIIYFCIFNYIFTHIKGKERKLKYVPLLSCHNNICWKKIFLKVAGMAREI